MNMFDVNGKLAKVDVRQTTYPIKGLSKSKTQQLVSELLQDKYPRSVILEEFTVPGSRLSVDFFLPKEWIVIEVQGAQHESHNTFFHGDKTKNNFAKQKINDRLKAEWAANNKIKFIEIFTTKEEEVNNIINDL